MTEQVNGYMIVARAVAVSSYQGVDREPWTAIGDAYYAGQLSEHERAAWEALRPSDLWWPTSPNRSAMEPLEAFLKRGGTKYDVLAVYSDYLNSSRHFRVNVPRDHVALGFDVVSVGEWSLLRALLESPSHASIANTINAQGLLNDPADAASIQTSYSEAMRRNEVEPIAESDAHPLVDTVSVFRILVE